MANALAPTRCSSFARYWTAAAISSFGTAVTAVAMPVLVVQLLQPSRSRSGGTAHGH
jgi:hypothetical protein